MSAGREIDMRVQHIGRGLALQQLWLFWVAPLIGGLVGGWLYRMVGADAFPKPNIEGN